MTSQYASIEAERYIPMYIRLREELRKMISARKSGEVLPTITAIKKQFKVSQPTVERAIQDLRAEGLIESRRGSGTYVTERAQIRHVGILFPNDILSPESGDFFRFLVRALGTQTSSSTLMMHYYLDAPGSSVMGSRYPAMLHDAKDRRLDAVVLLAAYPEEPMNLNIPVIGLGFLPQTTHRVHLDHPAAVRMAVEALVLGGCGRIALLESDVEPRAEPERLAFLSAVAAAGAASRPDWVKRVGGYLATRAIQSGGRALQALWGESGEKPDGLVCVDEYATRGVLDGAPALGLVPGQNLKIASYATKDAALLAGAPIIRIEFDPEDVARAMIALMGDLMDGRATGTDLLVPPSGFRGKTA